MIMWVSCKQETKNAWQLVWKFRGKRPGDRWKDYIKMVVSETSCEEENWIYLIYVITKYDWILCSVVDEPWGFIAA